MATSLISTLETIREKISSLTTALERERERCRLLEAENEKLREKAAEAEKAKEQALLDCDYMVFSHKLADSPDKLVETRRHIAGLIRTIDRCIEMLKE